MLSTEIVKEIKNERITCLINYITQNPMLTNLYAEVSPLGVLAIALCRTLTLCDFVILFSFKAFPSNSKRLIYELLLKYIYNNQHGIS